MPSLRTNIAANFIGKICLAAVAVIFPPILVRLLGIESYGLLGIYSSLNAALAVFDLGLTATLTREMARLSGDDTGEAGPALRDMTRTFELVFWAIGICVGGLVFLAAPIISNHWIHARTLRPEVVTSSVRLIGVVLALQWPGGMYNGGLLGLQRQISANVIQAIGVTLRFAGGAAILWKISPTIDAFFTWQAGVAGAQTIVTGVFLLKSLPKTDSRGTFRRSALLANWRYSAGASIITLLAMILTQADKAVVSKILPLEDFGYYTLAWTLCGGLGLFVAPVFIAVFPRLAQLARQNDAPQIKRLYHSSCQLVSVALLPACAVLTVFSREVLWAWTGNLTTVAAIRPVVIAVAIGTTLNGLMSIPYALQLAYGWTRLAAWANGIAVVVIVPLTIVLAKTFGTVGAACGWLVLNTGYVIFIIRVMHTRLLKTEQRRWYSVDVALPLSGALLAVLPIRIIVAAPSGRGASLILVVVAAVAAILGAATASPSIRRGALDARSRWSLRRRPDHRVRP
jgi:O-antigen/teichoic acid export membrane protein